VNSDGTTFGVFETNPDASGKHTETHFGNKNPAENFTATITTDAKFTKTIAYDNGGKRVINKDGSGLVQTPKARDGSYEVTVFGPEATPRYTVNIAPAADGARTYSYSTGAVRTVFRDGSKTESMAVPGTQTREQRDFDSNGRVRHIERIDQDGNRRTVKEVTEADILERLVDAKISQPEVRKMFRDYMQRFEDRAVRDHLTSDEVAATYRQAVRLLDAEDGNRHHPDRNAALAGHILCNAADPDRISAGDHHTERVAAVEASIYRFNPSAAGQLVADVAINGSFTDLRHNYVKVDATPHDSSSTFFPRDGERNHASEIFQVTAINLALSEKRSVRDPRMEYVQTRADSIGREDTGERLLIPARGGTLREVLDNWGNPVRRPQLSDEDVARLPSLISSRTNVPYLTHLLHTSGGTDHLTRIMSLEELRNTLLEQSRNAPDGEMHALAKVFSINEPFWSERQHKPTNRPDSTQEQTITIKRFIPGDGSSWGWVEVNSQLGGSGIHEGSNAIPLEDLYHAMRTADKNIPGLIREIERSDPAACDPLKQVNLIRMQVADGQLGDREAALRLSDLARSTALYQLRSSDPLDNDDRKRLVSGFNDVALHLPTRLALNVVEQERKNGLLTNKEYDQCLATLAWQVRREQARDAVWDRRINAAANRRRLAEVYSYVQTLSDDRRAAIQRKISELLILYP
jgi:hypothetical protein